VVERVRSMSGSEGLNAATGEYTDLVKLGVIDAAKVTRSALQNAASIAALFPHDRGGRGRQAREGSPGHPGGRHGGLLSLRDVSRKGFGPSGPAPSPFSRELLDVLRPSNQLSEPRHVGRG